jgi:demethylmacrocin O-methyltransferase
MKADGTPGHNYTEIYERYISHLRSTSIKILEIGFGGGDSLKLWDDYFDSSEIFCIDNNLSRIEEYGYKHQENIKIFFADQSRSDSIATAMESMGSPTFDIIVDDGSHIEPHINTTFYALFDRLKPGGIYFIEDAPSLMTFSHPEISKSEQFGELIVIEKNS